MGNSVGDLTNSNEFNVLNGLTGNQLNGGGSTRANVTPTFSQPNYDGGSGQVNIFSAFDSFDGISAQDPIRPSTKELSNRESYRGQ